MTGVYSRSDHHECRLGALHFIEVKAPKQQDMPIYESEFGFLVILNSILLGESFCLTPDIFAVCFYKLKYYSRENYRSNCGHVLSSGRVVIFLF